MLNNILGLINKGQYYILAGLAILSLSLSIGWYITNLKLDKEVAGREVDKANYTKAANEAVAKAEVAKAVKEKEYVEKAAEADVKYAALSDQYHAAVMRYQTIKNSSIRADLPRETSSPESSDGPDKDTVLSVTTEDALICADNTARLQVLQDWYTNLD